MSCECTTCQRTKRFMGILDSLESSRDTKFMDDIYMALSCNEENVAWYKYKHDMLLRFLNSKGYTLTDVEKFDEYIKSVDNEIDKLIE